MAFDNLKYTHSRDDIIINKAFQIKSKGQNLASVIAIIAISGGVTCILFGYGIYGTILGGWISKSCLRIFGKEINNFLDIDDKIKKTATNKSLSQWLVNEKIFNFVL